MACADASTAAPRWLRATLALGALLISLSHDSFAGFTVFLSRGDFEAALRNVKKEDLNSFTGPDHDLRSGGTCHGPLTIGDYTFSSTNACVAGQNVLVEDIGGVVGARLSQSGTASAGPTEIVIDINQPVGGIGFEFFCGSPFWRLDVAGNSGLHTQALDCVASGFLGIIDDKGGINSYTLYSDPSPDLSSLDVDNLTFGGLAPGGVPDGLAAWFRADVGVTAGIGGLVSRWEDQSGNNRDAVQADPNRQPELMMSVLGGNPTLRFETDSMPFDGTFLANSNYTVFAVEGRDRFGVANFFLGGSTAGVNQNLVLGYENEALLRQAHFGNDLDAVVPAYNGIQDFALTTFNFDESVGRTMHRFGLPVADDTSSAPLSSYSGAALGEFPALGFFYEGDLAELVIYNRALSCDERNAVNQALGNKYALAFTPETCGADLVVTKTDSVDPVIAGTSMSYIVTVTNNGPDAAQDVVVTDTLPAGVSFLSTSGCAEDPNGVPVCTLGTIGASSSKQYSITVMVNTSTTGILTNQASVASSTPEVNPGDESVAETTTTLASADLRVEVVDSPDPVQNQKDVTYIHSIGNAGPSAATGVQLDVLWPGGVRLVSVTPPPGGSCTEGASGIDCNLGSIPSGGDSQVQLILRLSAEIRGELVLTSTVNSATDDPQPGNNTVHTATAIDSDADLSFRLLALPPVTYLNHPVTIQVTVQNQGPVTATGAKFEIGIPDQIRILDLRPPDGVVCGRSPVVIQCNLPRMEDGAIIQFPIRVEPLIFPQVAFSGNLSGGNPDPDPTNNSDSLVIEVVELVGDLNRDGMVDVEDIGLLIREINDGDGEDVTDVGGGSVAGDALFDINGDGSINRRDLQALARIILRKEE